MFGRMKKYCTETNQLNGMSIRSMMKRMLILEYEIDLVHQDIGLIVHVFFDLNVTSWLLIPFVVLWYTSIKMKTD